MRLNGQWKLQYRDRLTGESGEIAASVPGNVELDFCKNGLLPEDLFMDTNITSAYDLERYDFTYSRLFEAEETGEYDLIFEGVDCVAEYYLNEKFIGASRNALVEHCFPVFLERGREYEIKVVLRSVCFEDNKNSYSLRTMSKCWAPSLTPSVSFRRAQHTYGWDIMPRAVSAGIWRDVRLEKREKYSFLQFYVACKEIFADGSAQVAVFFELNEQAYVTVRSGYIVKVFGKCGESEFSAQEEIFCRSGNFSVKVPSAKLWYPKNYGEPNLYDVRVELWRGDELLAYKETRFGIRSVKLCFQEGNRFDDGDFHFEINGKEVFVMGTNWVPLSPYHSQDKERLARALKLLDESGCNCVRCWGGNVYESDEFYDFADEHGIMVWQDFAFACVMYPDDEAFLREVEIEGEKVVKRLRQHPALVLWAGDNELDAVYNSLGYNPEDNEINRKILKRCVYNHDFNRPYLPSSPYITKGMKSMADSPEQHVWGDRNYYKNDFYKKTNATFISEIGYHGCVGLESAKKFIPEDELDNRHGESWKLHSSDCFLRKDRVELMEKQIGYMFGDIPADFEDFSFASQAVQAEAYKFFIENMRTNPKKKGILWWNLLDGWPQFSDAVVDYYFQEKLAYKEIKRVQQPFLMAIREGDNGKLNVFVCNHGSRNGTVKYEVVDANTREVYAKGVWDSEAGRVTSVAELQHLYMKKRLIFLRWRGDFAGFNYYIDGNPTFNIREFKEFRRKIDAENE